MRARSLVIVFLWLVEADAFSLPHVRKPHAPIAQHGFQVPVVGVERLKAAALATVASVALVASPLPAHAKGGGHGGGGGHSSSHSSSHGKSSASYRPSYPRSSSLSSSSSSRSRSSRQSSRSTSSSWPSHSSDRNLRIFPTDAMAREGGGLVCPADLPSIGSKVDVVGVGTATVLERRPALQSDLYPGQLVSQQPLALGFDGGCTLSVQYQDGSTDTISAAHAPKSQFEEALDIYAPPVFLAGYASLVLLGGPSSSADGYDGRHRDFHDMDVILSDVLDASAPPPDASTAEAAKALAALSGEFWGGSEGETDGGDQSVRVMLKFTRNGRIVGRGRDGEDGSYTISRGKWVREDDGKLWVAWEEVYDEGFRAICIGHIDVGSAKVTARFASSRRVSGGFQLAKKPSVF